MIKRPMIVIVIAMTMKKIKILIMVLNKQIRKFIIRASIILIVPTLMRNLIRTCKVNRYLKALRTFTALWISIEII